MRNGLVESGGETGWQGKLSPTTGMRFRFFLLPSLPRTIFLLPSKLLAALVPTHLRRRNAVVWARFAVERRSALRKLILPAISSCLHWFGLSENPEEWFLSQLHIRHTKTHPAFAPMARLCLLPPSPTLSAHVCIDYWKGTHWKFIRSRTHLHLESSRQIFSFRFPLSSSLVLQIYVVGYVDIDKRQLENLI